MFLRRHHVALLVGLAALAGGNGQTLAADQLSTTSVTASAAAPGLTAGFRTSDAGAAFVSCSLSGTIASCSVNNTNSAIPKNIGNILCLPSGYSKYQATATCQGLLGAPAGNCQQNSSIGKCPTGMTPVMPFCNYQTSSNPATVASWDWTVTLSASTGGTTTVDCQNPGYSGVSP